MTIEEKAIYKRLRRQINQSYEKLFDQGNGGGRIKKRSSKRYNNKLKEMKEFLSKLDGDYSGSSFMKFNSIP